MSLSGVGSGHAVASLAGFDCKDRQGRGVILRRRVLSSPLPLRQPVPWYDHRDSLAKFDCKGKDMILRRRLPQQLVRSFSWEGKNQQPPTTMTMEEELEEMLSKIVGLGVLKAQLKTWIKGMFLDERRRKLGLNVGDRRPTHMAFMGNPGTGKTTIARMMGRLLYSAEILPTDKVTEVQRCDLVGEYMGNTGPKTRKKIEEAQGGILFVDEAYRLKDDYGLEALEEIMSAMDSGTLVVIFAGYTQPMKSLISCNQGLRRRVTKFFNFDDFSCQELAMILHLKMNNQAKDKFLQGFRLHPCCSIDAIATLIQRGTTENQRQSANGGLVDLMLGNAKEKLNDRLKFEELDPCKMVTITLEDIEAGLSSLHPQQPPPKMTMDEVEETLSKIVGLSQLKGQLMTWIKGMISDERRRELGLYIGPRKPTHMAFMGNPGTGKTTIARTVGRLLYSMGILPTDKVTEVQRSDLVGEYVGKTGPKTRKKIEEAQGGILFVDEAYRLIPKGITYNDYGLEALEEIMSAMDSGQVLVIFAGYTQPMERVISSNQGLRRRVTKFFNFDDFTCQELAMILHLKMKNQAKYSFLRGFKLHPSCSVEAIARIIQSGTTENQRQSMNGGLVDLMLGNAKENLDHRLNLEHWDLYELLTITLEDLEAGLSSLNHECLDTDKDHGHPKCSCLDTDKGHGHALETYFC